MADIVKQDEANAADVTDEPALMPCPNCDGRGDIECDGCGGTGEGETCDECDGEGCDEDGNKCVECNGIGYYDCEMSDCGTMGNGRIECERCNGAGEIAP